MDKDIGAKWTFANELREAASLVEDEAAQRFRRIVANDEIQIPDNFLDDFRWEISGRANCWHLKGYANTERSKLFLAVVHSAFFPKMVKECVDDLWFTFLKKLEKLSETEKIFVHLWGPKPHMRFENMTDGALLVLLERPNLRLDLGGSGKSTLIDLADILIQEFKEANSTETFFELSEKAVEILLGGSQKPSLPAAVPSEEVNREELNREEP